jgi:hypothetical protein
MTATALWATDVRIGGAQCGARYGSEPVTKGWVHTASRSCPIRFGIGVSANDSNGESVLVGTSVLVPENDRGGSFTRLLALTRDRRGVALQSTGAVTVGVVPLALIHLSSSSR